MPRQGRGYAPNRGARTNVSRETFRWRDGGDARGGCSGCHLGRSRCKPRPSIILRQRRSCGVEASRAVPTGTLSAGSARDPTNSLALAIGWQRVGTAGRRWPFTKEPLSTWTQNDTHDNFWRFFGPFASGFQKGVRHIPRSRNARDGCDPSSPRVTLSWLPFCAHFSTLVGIPPSHERATRC